MKLLEMSISAGVLILILIILRTFGLQKIPKRLYVILWMVVLLRLLLPFELPLRNGIATPAIRFLQQILDFFSSALCKEGSTSPFSITKSALHAGMHNTKYGKHSISFYLDQKRYTLLLIIWFIGFLGFGFYFLYSLWKEYHLLKQALPLKFSTDTPSGPKAVESLYTLSLTTQKLVGIHSPKDSILFTHDQIVSPLVYGFIKQKIIIPKWMIQMEHQQMKYILTHEIIHIKRNDNFRKLLSAIVVCIHWFNPLVWIMYTLFARDLELACDEKVIALYGSEKRKDYAVTLLTLVQNQHTLFCSGFGKNPAKERITAIMKYKKLTGIGALCAVILLAGASTVFATNEQADPSEKKTAMQQETISSQEDEKSEKDLNDRTALYYAVEVGDSIYKLIDGDEKDNAEIIDISIQDEVDAAEKTENPLLTADEKKAEKNVSEKAKKKVDYTIRKTELISKSETNADISSAVIDFSEPINSIPEEILQEKTTNKTDHKH